MLFISVDWGDGSPSLHDDSDGCYSTAVAALRVACACSPARFTDWLRYGVLLIAHRDHRSAELPRWRWATSIRDLYGQIRSESDGQ